MSEDVAERLITLNMGKVKSTRSGIPWQLVYVETEFHETCEARKREKYLKSGAGRRYIQKMLSKPKVSSPLPAT